MKYFTSFLGDIISVLNCLLIVYFIFKCKIINNYKMVGCILVIYILFVLMILDKVLIWYLVGNLILQITILYVVIENTLLKKMTFIFVALLIDAFLQILVEIIFGYMNASTYSIEHLIVKLLTLITSMVLIVVTKKIFYKKETLHRDKWSFIYMNLLLGIFAGILPVIAVSLFQKSLNDKVSTAIVITSCLTVGMNMLVSYFYLKKNNENAYYKEEIELREELLNVQTEYINEVVDSYKNLKLFKHDIQSYIATIETLLLQKKYTALDELIREVKAKTKSTVLSQCTNIYIAATLNQFIILLEENNIKFNFTYNIFNELQMTSLDMCSLFYNLLSNAIEANIINEKEKEICLVLQGINNTLYIELENTISSTFDLEKIRLGISSKKDIKNHGLGLVNIHNIIDTYHGSVEYVVENNRLKTSIILLNVIE